MKITKRQKTIVEIQLSETETLELLSLLDEHLEHYPNSDWRDSFYTAVKTSLDNAPDDIQ